MIASHLQIVTAREARGFLLLIGTPARLPRAGKRLMVSAAREGGGLDSWIIERRPDAPHAAHASPTARYSITHVCNVAIDAVTPA